MMASASVDSRQQSKDWKRSGILRVDIVKPKTLTGTVDFQEPLMQLGQTKLEARGLTSPQPSVDRLSVTWAEPADSPNSESPTKVDFDFTPGSPPISSAMEVRFPGTSGDQEVSEDEDYSASVSAIMLRRASTRRSRKGPRSSRRPSSPFNPEISTIATGTSRRRSSAYTTSSGDTAISIDETPQEVTQEQIYENIRLHKEVLSSVKQQPWGMRRKLRLVYQAKAYIKRHEGALQERLALSKSTRDIVARFQILIAKKWQRLKREAANFSNWIIPWELRIKEIESHFGSVVASYFTFLRWLFWVNLVISATLTFFVIVPEIILMAGHEDTGERKEILWDERNKSTNLLILWEFEGVLKYSPIFYGYYTNIDPGHSGGGYRMPMAYFMAGLGVYVYSFVATLRKMAENSRMSKLSEKDDECIFSWKLFTGWDFMIGNAETAHNRAASIILGFKEALLEEAEKKKDPRNWKVISLRIIVNACVVFLLGVSAYAVIIVVRRSTEIETDGWWAQNEITIVMSLISFIFPIFFELLGFLESYHPRKQLRIQLARIMLLNLLNLYSLIFALFGKISNMTLQLKTLKPNGTVSTTQKNVISTSPYPKLYTTPNTTDFITASAIDTICRKIVTSCPLTEPTDAYKATETPQNLFKNISRIVTAMLFLGGSNENYTSFLNENITDFSEPTAFTLNINPSIGFNLSNNSYLALLNESSSMPSIYEEVFEFYDESYGDNNNIDYNSLSNLTNFSNEYEFISFINSSTLTKNSDNLLNSTELGNNSMKNFENTTEYLDFNVTNDNTTLSYNEFLDYIDINSTTSISFTEMEEVNATFYINSFGTDTSTIVMEDESITEHDMDGKTCYVIECEEKNTINTEDDTSREAIMPSVSVFNFKEESKVLDLITMEPISVHAEDTYNSHQLDLESRKKLRKLCWETMFGQELVKLTMMDLVLTILATLFVDFFRAVFVRCMNKCWCWDLEKKFPQYGDFKIAENILHLVNNQGMVWMGLFFSPGLALLNLIKLVIMMYLRSWAVMTCNVPHEIVFRASRSNNFYLALLLTMLFLCVLPVGYAIVRIEPSWHCGPFSKYNRIYYLFTESIEKALPTSLQQVVDYIASPGIVIPLLVLLILIIYYLISLTSSLREANNDLKIQLRRERTEERRKMFQLADRRRRGGSSEIENTAFSKWKKILPILPTNKSFESDEKKNNEEDGTEKKPEKKGDIFAKIVKLALRKSSEGELIEKKLSPPSADDETDTEFHESLPEDVLNVKDIKLDSRSDAKAKKYRRRESIDPAELILFPHRHQEHISSSKRTKKGTTKLSMENETKKHTKANVKNSDVNNATAEGLYSESEKPKLRSIRDVVKAKKAAKKVCKIEEVVKECVSNEDSIDFSPSRVLSKSVSESSNQSKQDSLTSIIPLIKISKTESDDEILDNTENDAHTSHAGALISYDKSKHQNTEKSSAANVTEIPKDLENPQRLKRRLLLRSLLIEAKKRQISENEDDSDTPSASESSQKVKQRLKRSPQIQKEDFGEKS